MTRTLVQIGPADDGRRMTLEAFRSADGQVGHRYELSRGVVAVMNIPNRRHLAMVNATRRQLSDYEATHPDVIQVLAAGSDCKIVVEPLESERHPDWAIYCSPMPHDVADDEELWAAWVPDLVIEVVSPGSGERDYTEKPEEYLRFGVPEYWVIDEQRQEMLVHRRVGDRYVLQVVAPGQSYEPRALKGLAFDVAAVFDAARRAGN